MEIDEDVRDYHQIAYQVAGVFSVLSVLISMYLIIMHNRYWTKPIVQKKITAILWMTPIYSVLSWFSLVYYESAVYLDMMRDIYEGYVIYVFLSLMVTYLGDGNEFRVVEIIEDLPPMYHPFPFNYIWSKPIPMDASFLRRCKFGTLQFVVVKPLSTLLAVIMEANGVYDQGTFRLDRGYIYVSFIQNVSITIAFYELVLFYVALKHHLKPYDPIPKFLSIKFVLFLSFWQSVFLAALAKFGYLHEVSHWTVENVSTGVQNLLICFEMFFASIFHHVAFSYKPYIKKGPIRRRLLPRSLNLRDQLPIDDTINDFNEVMPGRILLPSNFRPGAATIINHSAEQDAGSLSRNSFHRLESSASHPNNTDTDIDTGGANASQTETEGVDDDEEVEEGRGRIFFVKDLEDYAREQEEIDTQLEDDQDKVGWTL